MATKGQTVVLNRDDLTPGRVEAMVIEHISLDNFRSYLSKLIQEAEIVMFADTDGKVKILKNAFGKTGEVI